MARDTRVPCRFSRASRTLPGGRSSEVVRGAEMRALAFGGGTDSTGIIGGWVERGLVGAEPIDAVVFADTGGERPETYEHVARQRVACQTRNAARYYGT